MAVQLHNWSTKPLNTPTYYSGLFAWLEIFPTTALEMFNNWTNKFSNTGNNLYIMILKLRRSECTKYKETEMIEVNNYVPKFAN